MIDILRKYIFDDGIIWLLGNIIDSFQTEEGKGLPLGNLTSQLFANIYLNKFDQFIKHKMKAKFYIRYADDFVILPDDKDLLKNQVNLIKEFLLEELKSDVHPQKIFIKTVSSGVDFLGWINFPDHRILRKTTKIRMFNRLKNNFSNNSLNSYLGLIKYGNTMKIKSKIINNYRCFKI